jgi:hypothetical protein
MINRKRIGLAIALLVGIFAYLSEQGLIPRGTTVGDAEHGQHSAQPGDGTQIIADAYRAQRSDVQVRGRGIVKKVLNDDLKGSRHQRFLLRLENDQTLLVAHNIDLAPRIDDLREGDEVWFYGEYEWNNQGGVLHWTHHDPAGRHVDGWLRHRAKTYQ